ncbi:hypothetical protein Lalb_Chr12g0204771 [Lupinus albus]|uniref:Uncharacterized protein n=1 Tax=Lupinus albus TaxID=3870 RepID=A0A6A4PN78_LUPAL|nr:hypothetical protein Lalb_Chr12g0204771 [Lupinus albus]
MWMLWGGLWFFVCIPSRFVRSLTHFTTHALFFRPSTGPIYLLFRDTSACRYWALVHILILCRCITRIVTRNFGYDPHGVSYIFVSCSCIWVVSFN